VVSSRLGGLMRRATTDRIVAPGSVTFPGVDHDLGHFVSIGPATVSEDGSVITSHLGVGVIRVASPLA
jgi:hypothetical protein